MSQKFTKEINTHWKMSPHGYGFLNETTCIGIILKENH